MKQPNNLGTDRVSALILKLMIPSMIAQLVNVLYSIVDRIYIGNIPDTGALALAGAGICGPIVTFLSSFGTLVGLGGSILFSIRLGEEKKESARQILNNCFLLLVLLSLILTLAFLLLRRPLLYCFGASDMIFPYADTYMSIYTAGTFFALLSAGLNYFITCQGHPLLGMMTVMIGAILNLILDPLFIFGFGMGIAGAAVATVLSQITSCLFVFFVLFGHKVSIRIGFGFYQPKLMGRIILLGLSPFLILATDSLIMIAFNAMLQRYGGARSDMLIACATIVQSYMLLITAPMLGITGGCPAHFDSLSDFYRCHVPDLTDLSTLFCPYIYAGCFLHYPYRLGYPGLYPVHHTAQSAVHLCGLAHGPGSFSCIAAPVSVA